MLGKILSFSSMQAEPLGTPFKLSYMQLKLNALLLDIAS